MEEITQYLVKYFGIDENQINIFKTLLEHNNINAKEIAKLANINSGRIYEYINKLVTLNLVKKSSKRPYTYFIDDINESIIRFTKNKIDDLVRIQSNMLEYIDKKEQPFFERIDSSSAFTKNHVSMVSEDNNSFKYISLHKSFPYLLYPFDKENFVKLRKAITKDRNTITNSKTGEILLIRQAYIDSCEKMKNIEAIFEMNSFLHHIKIIKSLGNEFFEIWRESIIKQMKKYNIKVYVLNEYIPFQIDVSLNKVNVCFRYEEIISGIVIQEENMVKLYNKVFDQYKQRAQNIIPLIKRMDNENKHYQEIQIKAEINNPDDIVNKLISIGALYNKSSNHKDEYFEFSKDESPIFRVRTEEEITEFSIFSNKNKNKDEITWDVWKQTIENPDDLKYIFLTNNAKKIATIKKESSYYKFENLKISIDNIDNLGLFMNITTLTDNVKEGKSEIYSFLNQIGIKKEETLKSGYVTLLLKSSKNKSYP
jgi:predicted adenylyl cyclase CyaB